MPALTIYPREIIISEMIHPFVTFCSRKKEFSELSNFYIKPGHPFWFRGKQYTSAEHAFHAWKYFSVASVSEDDARREALEKHAMRFQVDGDVAPDPSQAKIMGGKGKTGFKLSESEQRVWNTASMQIQKDICMEKCKQFPEIVAALCKTGDMVLVHSAMRTSEAALLADPNHWCRKAIVETSPNGDQVIRVLGGNRLGVAWMETRATLA